MPVADIDFAGTDGVGRLSDGHYHARLDKVEERDGREWPLWVWTFASMEAETAGRQGQYTTSLSPKAAVFVRRVIEALGAEVPSSMARINTDHYLGRECTILVAQDGTYEGKDGNQYPNYKVQSVFPLVGDRAPVPMSVPTGASERDMVQFAADSDDIPF